MALCKQNSYLFVCAVFIQVFCLCLGFGGGVEINVHSYNKANQEILGPWTMNTGEDTSCTEI